VAEVPPGSGVQTTDAQPSVGSPGGSSSTGGSSGGSPLHDAPSDGRSPGLREALLVGELTVAVVLLAGVATFLIPGGRDLVLGTPLLIIVLIGGTAAVLWGISRPRR